MIDSKTLQGSLRYASGLDKLFTDTNRLIGQTPVLTESSRHSYSDTLGSLFWDDEAQRHVIGTENGFWYGDGSPVPNRNSTPSRWDTIINYQTTFNLFTGLLAFTALLSIALISFVIAHK